MNIVSFGEILWDNFKTGRKAGGAPMNVALHLHRQGAVSSLITSVGMDDDGKELLRFLERYGLKTGLVQIHPALPTGVVDVHLNHEQQASYTIKKPVAWDEISFNEQIRSAAEEADAIVFGSLASRLPVSRQTLLTLLGSAKMRIFDMNLRPPHFETSTLSTLLSYTDVLKINEDELGYLTSLYHLQSARIEEQIAEISETCGISTICVTLGGEGAIVRHENQLYRHPGFNVKVADTVGAGDAFLATFIKSFLDKESAGLTLERACAAGAIVASRSGANPEYTVDEILNHSLVPN